MKRVLLVLGLAGAALVAPAGPASAAACTSSGVTVQVDFASLGGGAQIGCAPGAPSSGVAALQQAGFPPTRAAQEPGYFVCRINDKPANAPCQRTSSSNAYWSYWHGKPGGGWTYSSTGPADYHPTPGTVEGWAFGAGKPPAAAPAAAARPPSAVSPALAASPRGKAATTPWSKGAAAPARMAASVGPAAHRPPAASASPAAASASAAAATPSAVASAAASPSLSPDPAADGMRSARTSFTGPALAVGLVALLIGGALLQRRRRSAGR